MARSKSSKVGGWSQAAAAAGVNATDPPPQLHLLADSAGIQLLTDEAAFGFEDGGGGISWIPQ